MFHHIDVNAGIVHSFSLLVSIETFCHFTADILCMPICSWIRNPKLSLSITPMSPFLFNNRPKLWTSLISEVYTIDCISNWKRFLGLRILKDVGAQLLHGPFSRNVYIKDLGISFYRMGNASMMIRKWSWKVFTLRWHGYVNDQKEIKRKILPIGSLQYGKTFFLATMTI